MECSPRSHRLLICFLLFFYLCRVHASIIESTMGAAVVNDATATYFNPGALILLQNIQAIPIGSLVYPRSQFHGVTTQQLTDFTQIGQASTATNIYLPSFYFGIPATKNITLGIGVIYNDVASYVPHNSLLRYVLPHSELRALDFVPALGIKLNEYFSVGAGVSLSQVHLENNLLTRHITEPINLASKTESTGRNQGIYVGFLLRPQKSTLIGLTYRARIHYKLHGKSILESSPPVISNSFHTSLSVPARYIFSVSHFFTSTLGAIGTAQFIEWRTLKDISMDDLAAEVGGLPVIIPSITIPKKRSDSWIATLGAQYLFKPYWIVRTALCYNQEPGNPHYELVHGDSLLLAVSSGYTVNEYFKVDVGYVHSFIKSRTINIRLNNITQGINRGWVDAISMKLTFNVL